MSDGERAKTSSSSRHARWIPAIVLVISLTLTLLASAYVRETARAQAETNFEAWVQTSVEAVNTRLAAYIALLHGTASYVAIEKDISRAEFRRYIDRLDLQTQYPGIQGIGLSVRLRPEEISDFEAQMQHEGQEDFRVWPQEPARPIYTTIAYLEPMDARNAAAIGYDMYSQEVRREAMRRAGRFGIVAASGPVRLVQEIYEDKQPGFLIYLPLYAHDQIPETDEARLELLEGYVYAPFRVNDLLDGIFVAGLSPYLRLDVYDATDADNQILMFRSTNDTSDHEPWLETTKLIEVAGRVWALRFSSRNAFEAAYGQQGLVLGIFLAGVIVSISVFMLTNSLAKARIAAENAAADLMVSQEALAKSKERYDLVSIATNDAIWDWDLASGRITWNRALYTVFGYDPSDLRYDIDWWEQHIHPDDRERVVHSIQRSIEMQSQSWIEEYRLLKADGDYANVLDRGYIARDPSGEAVRMIGSMVDMTRQKRAEEALRHANETLETRVAERTASLVAYQERLRQLGAQVTLTAQRERRRLAQLLHDHLQQLLVAGKLRLSMVLGRVRDEQVCEALGRVTELLEESVQVSRNLAVELSPPVLHDAGLIPALHWLARQQLEKYGLKVTVDADPDAEPEAEDVRVLLFHVVRELLFNVLKHAKVSEATVQVDCVDDQVRIRVIDQGAGFEASQLYEPAPDTESFGLFSVRERLEIIGGEMTIDSEPGQGTTVTILAPRDDASSQQGTQAGPLRTLTPTVQPQPTTASANGVTRVLIADDQRIMREGLIALLQQTPGIEIVGEASDGQKAIELARGLQPDVVLMDVTMPGISGIDATRAIHNEMPGIRIIGLSMHDNEHVAAAMRQAGASAYLTKGGPSDELIQTIRGHATDNGSAT